MNDEYLCLALAANPGETEPAFKSRLVAFWSYFLRSRPDAYESVYSEATEFEQDKGLLVRRYMVHPDGLLTLLPDLAAHGIAFQPVDEDDHYSKAEASASDWFQIDH